MDIPIWLIVVAIFALIIALALLWVDRIEVPRHASERYIRELQAETEMIKTVKPVVAGNAVMLPMIGEHGLTWKREDVSQQIGQGQQTPAVDITSYALHDDCVELVNATIKNPPSDKYKRDPNQLMTADECQERGVLGGDRTRRQTAVEYLSKFYNVEQRSNMGRNNGVFYRGGDLSALMLDLAVHGKVPYPAQVPPSPSIA